MSAEIDSLVGAQTAVENAAKAAEAKMKAMADEIAALKAAATDAAAIPPITAALQASADALNAAVAVVPA